MAPRYDTPLPRFSASGLFPCSSAAESADFFWRSLRSISYLHATYFVVAHFHFVMAVAALFGVFAGTYFWFPKMFGRMMNETLGKWHFWLTFVGVYSIFMPMHYLGLAGNVRRYSAFIDDYLIAADSRASVHHRRCAC